MKTRSIHELLQLTLDNFDKYFAMGLCGLAQNMLHYKVINETEHKNLKKYYYDNFPSEWYNLTFVWKPTEKEPRIKWVIEQIDKTK